MPENERFWDRRMETIPRDELRVVQGHRLHWQVQRCMDGSPFYRRRLQAAGVSAGEIRAVGDALRLPLLRPDELAAERRAHPPYGRLVVAPDDWLHLAGPEHPPDSAPTTEADRIHRVSVAARALTAFGVRPGDVVVLDPSLDLLIAEVVAEAVDKIRLIGTPSAAPPADERAAASRRFVVVPPGTAQADGDISGSRRSSAADSSERVVVWGKVLSPPLREPDRGATLDSTYRAVGDRVLGATLAAECEARAGLHWTEDHLLIEVVDEASRPLEDGSPGWLVLSHLTREAVPLLRYWTGLRARLVTTPCRCGRTHARSEQITPAAADARRSDR